LNPYAYKIRFMLTAKQFIQDIKSLDVKSCVFTNNVPKKTMPNLGLRGKLPALEKKCDA